MRKEILRKEILRKEILRKSSFEIIVLKLFIKMTDQNLVIAKKERAIVRESINKFIAKIETLSKDENPDMLDLEESLELLTETASELKIKDTEIKTLTQEAQLDVEFQATNEYREKIISGIFKPTEN